jgi:formiminotetrahydrofolate cyclodeaminase
MTRQQQSSLRACRERVEAARRVLIDTALDAHEDAGFRGLCADGRWEAAVDAMRSLDLAEIERPRRDQPRSDQLDGWSRETTRLLIEGLTRAADAVSLNSTSPPGGGSVAASVGAFAAALTQAVAQLTNGRARYADVADEMNAIAERAGILVDELTALVERDAAVFEALASTYKHARTTDEPDDSRASAIRRALIAAAEPPRDIARAAASVAELAASVAERGNVNAVADAAVAALIADSVCRASALTVRVNVAGCRDAPGAEALAQAAADFADAASRAAARAVTAAERAC